MTRERQAADARPLSIGQAAAATGLSVKTIRYYEEIGLIARAPRGNGAARTGGNRLYTEAAIGRLEFVHSARMLGLSLEDIRRLMAIAQYGCPGDRPEYRSILMRHLEDIDTRFARLAQLHAQIKRLLRRKRGARSMACDWESCDCLSADAASTRGRDKTKRDDHVRPVRLQRI